MGFNSGFKGLIPKFLTHYIVTIILLSLVQHMNQMVVYKKQLEIPLMMGLWKSETCRVKKEINTQNKEFFWYSIFIAEHFFHSFSFSLTCYTYPLYVYSVTAAPDHTQRHKHERAREVGLLWTRDRPTAETSTWQENTHKREPCFRRYSTPHTHKTEPCFRRYSTPQAQQASGRRPRP